MVLHVGGLLSSLMSPLAWNVPSGQLFQYCADSVRSESASARLLVYCVGEQRQLPAEATQVSVCTTV